MDRHTERVLRILSREGDIQVKWRPSYKVEVDLASVEFDKLTSQGYAMFAVAAPGAKPTQVRTFDPEAFEILATPALAGG